jgi:hypothetical protein
MYQQIIRTNLSLQLQQCSVGTGMPRPRVVRKQSLNGEIHLIIPDSIYASTKDTAEDLDENEIRKIMKKEASKPLLLLRAE